MCYEYDSYYLRARALEALRRKAPVADELARPAEPAPTTEPPKTEVPVDRPETVPA